ncbi:MAG TPA: STAS/SEC14 domain-containing protein [Smithella sp.]|nr:STAS/SEC14 domain-containing protein [Smithella sp.]
MEKKQTYNLSTSVNEDILEIIITGEITADCIEKLQNEVIAVTQSINPRNVLVDVSALKGRFGFTEAYFRVRDYPSDLPRVNIACVDLAQNAEYQSFHESTSVNAGLSFKWFSNIEAARAWLKKQV